MEPRKFRGSLNLLQNQNSFSCRNFLGQNHFKVWILNQKFQNKIHFVMNLGLGWNCLDFWFWLRNLFETNLNITMLSSNNSCNVFGCEFGEFLFQPQNFLTFCGFLFLSQTKVNIANVDSQFLGNVHE